ncbi:hypothetical protein DFJ74DRAFT_717475, partial [Hyaloraphidium curvatum]
APGAAPAAPPRRCGARARPVPAEHDGAAVAAALLLGRGAGHGLGGPGHRLAQRPPRVPAGRQPAHPASRGGGAGVEPLIRRPRDRMPPRGLLGALHSWVRLGVLPRHRGCTRHPAPRWHRRREDRHRKHGHRHLPRPGEPDRAHAAARLGRRRVDRQPADGNAQDHRQGGRTDHPAPCTHHRAPQGHHSSAAGHHGPPADPMLVARLDVTGWRARRPERLLVRQHGRRLGAARGHVQIRQLHVRPAEGPVLRHPQGPRQLHRPHLRPPLPRALLCPRALGGLRAARQLQHHRLRRLPVHQRPHRALCRRPHLHAGPGGRMGRHRRGIPGHPDGLLLWQHVWPRRVRRLARQGLLRGLLLRRFRTREGGGGVGPERAHVVGHGHGSRAVREPGAHARRRRYQRPGVRRRRVPAGRTELQGPLPRGSLRRHVVGEPRRGHGRRRQGAGCGIRHLRAVPLRRRRILQGLPHRRPLRSFGDHGQQHRHLAHPLAHLVPPPAPGPGLGDRPRPVGPHPPRRVGDPHPPVLRRPRNVRAGLHGAAGRLLPHLRTREHAVRGAVPAARTLRGGARGRGAVVGAAVQRRVRGFAGDGAGAVPGGGVRVRGGDLHDGAARVQHHRQVRERGHVRAAALMASRGMLRSAQLIRQGKWHWIFWGTRRWRGKPALHLARMLSGFQTASVSAQFRNLCSSSGPASKRTLWKW